MRLRRPAPTLALVPLLLTAALLTAALLTAALLTAAPVTGASAAAPTAGDRSYCGQRWGSLPEGSGGSSTAEVSDLRAGRHACFDRLVLDVDGPLGRWSVRYVDRVHRDGSGTPVPLRGGARLEVALHQPPVPSDAWFLPNGELLETSRFRTFRHLAWAGDSAGGRTLLGLGVRARLPFRVLALDGPGGRSRLVVDVAHRW